MLPVLIGPGLLFRAINAFPALSFLNLWVPQALTLIGGVVCVYVDRKLIKRHQPSPEAKSLFERLDDYPHSFICLPLLLWGWMFITTMLIWSLLKVAGVPAEAPGFDWRAMFVD